MCGRFTLTAKPAELQELFTFIQQPIDLAPRYNIAPSQAVAVIPNENERKLEMFKWGLIPSWAKDPKIGYKMINARAETLAEKPAFRTALKRRRCLVVADGFFEWKKDGTAKQPMYITLKDGRPFAFAGLWEVWKDPKGEWLKTCTIVTTEPNELMADIHNRMPVILKPEAYDQWLTPGDLGTVEALSLLGPYDARQMQAVPVSTAVNSPAMDNPQLVMPLAV
jgi:putative SOS response-associated peptidase YedK